MLDLGFVSANACERWHDKTPFLPSFSFHEQHESLPIKATAESIIQVVSTLDVRADPVINTLMLMREGVSN